MAESNSQLQEVRQSVQDVFVVPQNLADMQPRDPEVQARVNEIIDTYPQDVVERALSEAVDFEQFLRDHPELNELIYETAQTVGIDAEFGRAAKEQELTSSRFKSWLSRYI